MTGPEHYREAEKALDGAAKAEFGSSSERYQLARAQVHATLALAAATAIQPATYEGQRPEWSEWAAVASVETARLNRSGGDVR
jgi:hypothetical protein